MAVAQFTREYSTVRRAEGWGSRDSAYYQALPFHDLSGRFPGIWRIRARSYATFLERVLIPLERRSPDDDRPVGTSVVMTDDLPRADPSVTDDGYQPIASSRRQLRILDLGAGNGWLANRLAARGHRVTAIDLLDDPLDGLGAAQHYATSFAPVLAEFDHLPLASGQMDLGIFNASLHYSTNYATTLAEILRVLHAAGTLIILDSPMYADPTSGARMVQERQARFQATYGFASNALPSEHFLTRARLDKLGAQLGLSWQLHQPGLDWRSRLSRTMGGIRARREPARFPVIVGRCR
jgi:SAM-dependent methyltransferase